MQMNRMRDGHEGTLRLLDDPERPDVGRWQLD